MTVRAYDRRAVRRVSGGVHVLAARVRPGPPVSVIDVSSRGVLIETPQRLLPGAAVEFHVQTLKRDANLRGRVVRCAIVRLASAAVDYRAAIAFDRECPWLVDDAGEYLVPRTANAGTDPWVAATRKLP